MFVIFFRFVFMGMKMGMGIGLSDFFGSLSCHTGDQMLMSVLMCVLNPDRIVDQKPGGNAHENQT
jgi:hypothetical protein